MIHTKELLDFIIKQGLPDVKYYPDLIPIIDLHFSITKRHDKKEFAKELIQDVINWENGNQQDSLEATLSGKYIIEIRDEPKKHLMFKVIKDKKL